MQEARIAAGKNPLPVLIRDRRGAVRSHEAWKHNPRITLDEDCEHEELVNRPGIRPYIAEKSPSKWSWKNFTCPRGELYFSKEELEFARPYNPHVILEPNIKDRASPNKQWGWIRWNKLAYLLREAGATVYQMGERSDRLLERVHYIHTPTFRHAAAVLARAQVAVLPEGGLHHAAAAVGTRAVVLFGGYISPRQTGYATQTNKYAGGEPCGNRTPCKHCEKAMASILPEQVCIDTLGRINASSV